MASTILVKRSATPAKVPTTANLSLGELGLNTYDGALYFKKNVTGVESIVTVSIVGNAEVFTNKTFDTAATGNVFQINGTAISAVSGTGSTVVLSSGPSISNLTLTGTLTAGGSGGTSGQVLQSTGTGVQWASSSASISITDDTSTNSTFYPSFVNTTSGNLTTNYVSSSKLTYNPSTGTLGASALLSTSLTAPTISTLSLDTGTTGSINLGTGANAKAISLGNSSVASTIALNNNTTLAAGKTVTLSGSTSGTIALQAAAIAGTNTITFPASTGTVALTSGTGDGTLTMGVSGVGLSGSATFTANQSGASTFTVTSNATSANTVSTIVSRDASGGFSAGTITAALSGNATTATSATTATTAGSVTNAATFNNSGTGAASGTTFDGSAARTISYNTLGASPLAGSTSLTTTGTVTTGTWSGLFGAVSGANLTNLTAGNLSGTIPTAVLGNSTLYVGTTAILLNRASASQALTGITSIDGSAASVANALTFSNGGAGDASGTTFNGSAARTISYNSVGASPLAGSSSIVTTGSVTAGTWKSGLDAETYSTSASVSAGTNNQGQGALTSDYNVITTTAANPSGVTLPVPTVGRRIIVVNKGANPINVYPTTGTAIDALGANVAISLAVAGWIEFNASSTTQWYSTAGISTSGTAGSVANSVTFNSGGAGGTSPTTFNGSAAQTISYNTLGASPLAGSSSLTTTGTVTSGTWSGSFGAVSGANLTSLTAGNLSGTIPSAVLGNSTAYVGTTAILLNRASAAQSLTGITSIDGSSASLTTSRTLWGQSFNGTANVTGSLTSVGDITGTGAVNLTATAAALGLVATGANSITASTNGSTRVTIDSSGNTTFTGQVISTQANSTTTGAGQIYLNGATGNRIDFNTNGVAAPATTTRSAGTKIVLYPGITASAADYALGIEGSTIWSSVPTTSEQFKWYAGTTNIATLSGAGALSVTGTVTTNSGRLYLRDNSIEEYSTNANSNIGVNYSGYLGGTTQFRDFYVYNGKQGTILSIIGSTGNSTFTGTVTGTQLISNIATGTAPLSVTSTTVVPNLNTTYLNGYTDVQLAENLRANHNISGGGTITVDASGNVLWSARFIVISNGSGTNFSTVGYFDITCPTSGTITGVGGAANATATAAGIPLAAWQAIYYILPIGSTNTSVAANFRIAAYTSTLDIPSTWVLICLRNGDDGTFHFNNGIVLSVGQAMNFVQQATANTANTLVRRDASGNFSAGTVSAALTGNVTGNVSGSSGSCTGNSATVTNGFYTTSSFNLGTTSIAVNRASAAQSLTGITSIDGSSASVANALTFNNGGAGAASGTTFNGSAAQTVSYNTVGASPLAGSSSLTTTGTVTSGTWSGSFGAVSGANLTSLTAGNLSGTIPSAVLGNSTHYVGTTAVALNRASANQALTGILSVAMPGSTSGTITLQPTAVAGANTITLPASTGTAALTSDIGNGTLTLAVSGTGLSGSASFTANQSGATTFTVTSNATNANTASTIVARDASGNFSAGTVSAALTGNVTGNVSGSSGSCTGNAATATTATNQSGGTVSATTGSFSSTVTGPTAATGTNTTQLATTAFVVTAIANAQPIPAGTVSLFYQAAAPTGWTQVVTQNNKAIRVVSGTGGGTGGTTAFTSVFTSRTPAGTVAMTNAAFTLTTTEMPSHAHRPSTYAINQSWSVGSSGAFASSFGGSTSVDNAPDTGSAGSSGSHTHANTAAFTGTALDFAVQYIDIIICSKN